jgi:hypothetical protein
MPSMARRQHLSRTMRTGERYTVRKETAATAVELQ